MRYMCLCLKQAFRLPSSCYEHVLVTCVWKHTHTPPQAQSQGLNRAINTKAMFIDLQASLSFPKFVVRLLAEGSMWALSREI